MEINKYKIIDIGRLELSIPDLLEKYFSNSEYYTSRSVILTNSYNNIIEYYSISDEQIDDSKKEDTESPAEKTINDLTSIANTISFGSSDYRYTKGNIDNFFSSDSSQQLIKTDNNETN